MGDNRKDIRLSVLKVLEDAPHIMLEPLGQRRDILSRKERDQVHRLGRITPQQLNALFSLEDSGDLVAREQDGHLASRGPKPVDKLPLGMRVRSIHFIQNKTHRHLVSSKEGRNTACVLAGLGQGLDVRKAAQLARCVQFEQVKPTGLGGCENQCGLPDSGWAMKKQALGVRRRLEIGLETGLDLCMSGDVLKDLRAPGFAPHTLSS
jgi:hypothetical protein